MSTGYYQSRHPRTGADRAWVTNDQGNKQHLPRRILIISPQDQDQTRNHQGAAHDDRVPGTEVRLEAQSRSPILIFCCPGRKADRGEPNACKIK